MDGIWEGEVGEVVLVFAKGLEGEGLFWASRDEGDGVVKACDVDGDCGTPGTGSKDCEIHKGYNCWDWGSFQVK